MIQASPKKVADSSSEMTQIVLPNDTNMLGKLLGGTLMHWIDIIGAIVANRHCRKPIVTASMERIDFLHPIPLGHLVILKGCMQSVGRTSMKVRVVVFSEDPLTGRCSQASNAMLTYVAVNRGGKPIEVPQLILASEVEKKSCSEAEAQKRTEVMDHQYKPEGSA